jgi:hypothetical protein
MHRFLVVAVFLWLLTGSTAARFNPQTEKKAEQYSATAFLVGIAAPGGVQNTLPLDFYFYDYTPDDELKSLIAIFKDQGEAGIEKAFSKMKDRGRMSTDLRPSLGSLKFIRAVTKGNETVIRMVTDRILSFQERIDNSALSKYRFSVVELHLDAQGKGQGKLTYAAKLNLDDQGQLDIESYDAIPIPLNNVRKLK